MKLREMIAEAEARLLAGPHPVGAKMDAVFLAQEVLGQNRAWILTHYDSEINEKENDRYFAWIARRQAGEPVQYLLGKAEFYGREFVVRPGVLIPRPETEHLVEKALELANDFAAPKIVDIGTGSGAIAVTVALELPQAAITAVDLSPEALEIAQENAENLGAKINFKNGDLLEDIEESFDLVLSNPPYIPESDRASLAVEVREHEPAMALFAGDDGLEVYRRLIPQAWARLVAGGWLLMEIGWGQAGSIRTLLEAAGFGNVIFIKDLAGIDRVACAQRVSNC